MREVYICATMKSTCCWSSSTVSKKGVFENHRVGQRISLCQMSIPPPLLQEGLDLELETVLRKSETVLVWEAYQWKVDRVHCRANNS